jgi:hypothetical protein
MKISAGIVLQAGFRLKMQGKTGRETGKALILNPIKIRKE